MGGVARFSATGQKLLNGFSHIAKGKIFKTIRMGETDLRGTFGRGIPMNLTPIVSPKQGYGGVSSIRLQPRILRPEPWER
jgi:hypothetical protein